MNEAQRGIAAYRSVAGKRGKASKRKEDADALSVEISAVGNKAGTDRSAKSAPVPSGAKRAPAHPEKHTASGQKPPKGAARGPKPAAEKKGGQPGLEAPPAKSPAAGSEGLLRAGADSQGYRKVAKFLLLLGREEASKILKHFSTQEIEGITRELARVRSIGAGEASSILKEFGAARGRSRTVKAGPEAAERILVAAFGAQRGNALLRRAIPEAAAPFQFLNDLDPEQVLLLLKNESAPTVGIILPHLKPAHAARILERLPKDIQRDVVRRVARLERIDQEVVERIENVLKDRIRTVGHVVTQEIDGRSALAEILKHMSLSAEESILSDLEEIDPALSKEVKDRVFTIDLIFKLSDTDLQAVLRDFDDGELAIVLKGKRAEVVKRVVANVSSRRGAVIEEESARLGKMRKSDVDRATKDFLDYLIDLEGEGKITIHWDDRLVD